MLIFYSETLLKQFTNLSSSGWSLSVLSPHMHVYISLSCSNLNVFCFLHLFDYLWLGAAVLKRNWGVWSSFCLLDQEWTDFHHWPCHSLSNGLYSIEVCCLYPEFVERYFTWKKAEYCKTLWISRDTWLSASEMWWIKVKDFHKLEYNYIPLISHIAPHSGTLAFLIV